MNVVDYTVGEVVVSVLCFLPAMHPCLTLVLMVLFFLSLSTVLLYPCVSLFIRRERVTGEPTRDPLT